MVNLWQDIAGSGSADSGGVWDRLERHLAEPAPNPEGAAGLWGRSVVARADGLWAEANRETMLLRRPELGRADLWTQAGDETLILPRVGLIPIWDAVLAQAADGAGWDLANTIAMHRPELAEDMWSRAQAETVVISRAARENVFAAEVASRNLTTWKPRRKSGFALKKLTDQGGTTYLILKNLRDNTYVRLSEEQVFVWEELDGDSSVQDIAMAYLIRYGKLAINSLVLLLEQLQDKGFIEDPLVNVYGAVESSMARQRTNVWWRRAIGAFLNKEFAIQGIDGLIAATHRRFGWVLFTRPAAIVLLLVAVLGAIAFGLHLRAGPYSVFTGAGDLLIVGIVTLYLLQAITLLIHEWAHAVTTKHYRREVRKGGFLLYLGMPAAFVDTTDIWLSPRRERILVSWAGPYSGFILGGLAALIILAVPGTFAAGVLFQFAFLTYLTSFLNLNPLLKLDGYYILMDWLEIPRLREKSLAFVGRPLRAKLRRREPFSPEERIFAVFGLLAGAWTILALLAALQLWGGALLDLLRGLLGG
jgi:putative peptide zinc metalloprotease protein